MAEVPIKLQKFKLSILLKCYQEQITVFKHSKGIQSCRICLSFSFTVNIHKHFWMSISVLCVLSRSGSGSGPVSRSSLCGGGRGEAQDVAYTLLFQTLQRPRPSPAIGQHGLRLQSQPGHLPAGKHCSTPRPQSQCKGILLETVKDRYRLWVEVKVFDPALTVSVLWLAAGYFRTRPHYCVRGHESTAPWQVHQSLHQPFRLFLSIHCTRLTLRHVCVSGFG